MRPKREAIRTNRYAYFVSTQTANRQPFFRHERWAQLMMGTLKRYAGSQFQLHAYVVMPDHLHLLITPHEAVEKAIQLVKGRFSFRVTKELDWKGEVWQKGFTDHRVRDAEDWEHHVEYIRLNPLRARIVEESALYPYMEFPNSIFPQGLKPTDLGTDGCTG